MLGAYAPYSRPEIGLGKFPGEGAPVYTVPQGWYRPARDFIVEFWTRFGRAPNDAEYKIIAEQVSQIRGGQMRHEELTSEHHHNVMDFFLKNGRMPTGYPSNDAGENQQLVRNAIASVDDHVRGYAAAHPSAWESVVSVGGDVLAVAQVAVSFVPGIGAGVNAAIAAGIALSKGESITDAVIDAAKNALPGGPLAAQGFDAAVAAGKALARGDNIGDAALAAAREAIPSEEGKRAFDVGLAVVHGQNVQTALVQGAASLAGKAVAALAPAALPSELSGIAEKLTPETTRIATAIFNRPELHGKSAPEIAQALHSDVATVNQATQAVGAAWQTLATLTPAQQKSLSAWAALSTLTPEQQKQLVALAHKKPPTLKAAKAVAAAKPPPSPKPPAPATTKVAMAYAPYPKHASGAVSAPPHIPHPSMHRGGGHPPIFRGGRVVPGWGGPWWGGTEIIMTTGMCRSWGDPVTLSPSMQVAAKVAMGASGGRPTTLRGDDGVLYLVSLEGGALTARPCVALAVA